LSSRPSSRSLWSSKELGTPIPVTAETHAAAGPEVVGEAQRLGGLQVWGKAEALDIYRMQRLKPGTTEAQSAWEPKTRGHSVF
jgi:hypothetical protein